VGIVLVLLIIQIMAAIWYSLSYVPFGRKAVKEFLKRTICKPCWDMYNESKGGGGASPAVLDADFEILPAWYIFNI